MALTIDQHSFCMRRESNPPEKEDIKKAQMSNRLAWKDWMRFDRLVLSVEGNLFSLLSVCCWQGWVHQCQNEKEDFLSNSLPWADIWTHLLDGYNSVQCDDLHNNGLTFVFYTKYLLLALTDSGLTNMALISGCLGFIIQILQTFYEINVNWMKPKANTEKNKNSTAMKIFFVSPHEG